MPCHWQTRQQVESLQNGEECECEELRLRRGSPLVGGVMCFVNSSSSTVIGERAKRARHSQVCSIENRGYIYYYYI